jgi:hypothetical protein
MEIVSNETELFYKVVNHDRTLDDNNALCGDYRVCGVLEFCGNGSGSRRGNVEKTANKNAAKVDRADARGGAAERKAMHDRDRIERRAEDHASRAETAVDKSMDAVKNAVDNVKDAFSK